MKIALRSLMPLLALVSLLSGGPAQGAIESELVQKGVTAYGELDYAHAVELLKRALAETLTREEKITTYQTLAFALVALGRADEASGAFQQLLRIDGSFELDRTISPRVRAVFERAKAAVATDQSGQARTALLPTIPAELRPAHPKHDQPLELRVVYAGGVAEKMEVFYRTRGQRVFSRLVVSAAPGGRFLAQVPGLGVQPPALEYYFVLLDESGSSVARSGSLGEPLAIEIAAPGRPFYRKALFWGLLGGVAAAGALAAVLATTVFGGSTIGPTTPASITITPH